MRRISVGTDVVSREKSATAASRDRGRSSSDVLHARCPAPLEHLTTIHVGGLPAAADNRDGVGTMLIRERGLDPFRNNYNISGHF
jgi:hypothetical protein